MGFGDGEGAAPSVGGGTGAQPAGVAQFVPETSESKERKDKGDSVQSTEADGKGADAALERVAPPADVSFYETILVPAPLPEALKEAVLAALGADKTDTVADVLHIPLDAAATAIQNAVVKRDDSTEGKPTPLQFGKSLTALQAMHAKFRPPAKIPPLSVPPTAPPTVTVQMPVEDDSLISFASVLAQGLTGKFHTLGATKLTALRQALFDAVGDHPQPEARPSNRQISALKAWLVKQMKAPFADFAIFGPHGDRTLKGRAFAVQAFAPDGTWRPQRLLGPNCFAEWEACWEIFFNCMVMLGAASPAQLNRYAAGISKLCQRFPGQWHEISMADGFMRAEQWDLVFEEGLASGAYTASPGIWGAVIRDSAYGGFQGPRATWWDDQLVFRLSQAGRGAPAPDRGDLILDTPFAGGKLMRKPKGQRGGPGLNSRSSPQQ